MKIHGSSQEAKSPFRYSRFKKSFTLLSSDTPEEYIRELIELIEQKSIDLVLPIDEKTYLFFAEHSDSFSGKARLAAFSPFATLEIATNKFRLAKFCESRNIPSPKTTFLKDYRDEKNPSHQAISLPLIVKPETGWGGRNVYHIAREEDFSVIKPTSHPKEGEYIVQEYVDGYDIDMSLLARNGEILAHTIQKGFLKRANRFAASAGLEFQKNEGVYGSVCKLVRELDFSGIAHVDLRYDTQDGEFKIIEINARYWGSLIASFRAGVNFPYLHILSSLEEEVPAASFEPIHYMDFISALKASKHSLFSKRSLPFQWKDTDYPFFLADPIAECYNAWKRRIR
ncbi:ATP-grasp domain-containing protein [Cyclobacterium salsum]|uniref:ATP-grasp domain-containing protein n=1 Tax=Cyclobacterium salsum TaxID=2666329 RepID=UPI001391BA85|nr:ATP-grasp domain-containing protein [Cyclobacterium salsum]